jgi:hypothetical protein
LRENAQPSIRGLDLLWARTLGNNSISIAVLMSQPAWKDQEEANSFLHEAEQLLGAQAQTSSPKIEWLRVPL